MKGTPRLPRATVCKGGADGTSTVSEAVFNHARQFTESKGPDPDETNFQPEMVERLRLEHQPRARFDAVPKCLNFAERRRLHAELKGRCDRCLEELGNRDLDLFE